MSEQVKPASEQGPAAYLFEDGSAVSVADLEFSPEKSGQRVVPLYLAPQPGYKAQRDSLLARIEVINEVHVISATYDRIRSERIFAADDIEYDLFASGWKAAVEALTLEDA